MSRYLTKKPFDTERFFAYSKGKPCFWALKNGSPRSSRRIFYVARPQSSQALYKQLQSNSYKKSLLPLACHNIIPQKFDLSIPFLKFFEFFCGENALWKRKVLIRMFNSI